MTTVGSEMREKFFHPCVQSRFLYTLYYLPNKKIKKLISKTLALVIIWNNLDI